MDVVMDIVGEEYRSDISGFSFIARKDLFRSHLWKCHGSADASTSAQDVMTSGQCGCTDFDLKSVSVSPIQGLSRAAPCNEHPSPSPPPPLHGSGRCTQVGVSRDACCTLLRINRLGAKAVSRFTFEFVIGVCALVVMRAALLLTCAHQTARFTFPPYHPPIPPYVYMLCHCQRKPQCKRKDSEVVTETKHTGSVAINVGNEVKPVGVGG